MLLTTSAGRGHHRGLNPRRGSFSQARWQSTDGFEMKQQAVRWVLTSLQSEDRSSRVSRFAPYRCAVFPLLVAQVRTVALSSLTLLGLVSPWSVVGGEQPMPSGDGVSAVRVTTDKASYGTGQSIVVTIVNGLSVPIYALSGQTYCTIVTIQRHTDGQWGAEGRCLSYTPPGWVDIAARGSTLVEVRPRLPSDRPLGPGRYRAVLTFAVGSTTGPSATAFSSDFLISDQGHVLSVTALTSCPSGQMA